MTLTELVDQLRAAHDEACADVSEAQHALDDATTRRRALEATLVALEHLTGEPDATLPDDEAPSDGVRVSADRLTEVARLAALAAERGVSIRNYVAVKLGVNPVYAGQLLTAARRAGHDVPYERQPKISGGGAVPPAAPPPEPRTADDLPGPDGRSRTTWTPKPGELVVQCDDCGHTEPITGCTALNRHCLAQHRRAATIDERSPRPWQEAS